MARLAIQAQQKGTGHAVSRPRTRSTGYDGPVLILYGDTPFVEAETLRRMLERLEANDAPGVVVLASVPPTAALWPHLSARATGSPRWSSIRTRPKRSGRSPVQFRPDGGALGDLCRWLARVGNDNAAGEYYLPDIVMIAAAEGRDSAVIEGDPYEVEGINSRAELAH